MNTINAKDLVLTSFNVTANDGKVKEHAANTAEKLIDFTVSGESTVTINEVQPSVAQIVLAFEKAGLINPASLKVLANGGFNGIFASKKGNGNIVTTSEIIKTPAGSLEGVINAALIPDNLLLEAIANNLAAVKPTIIKRLIKQNVRAAKLSLIDDIACNKLLEFEQELMTTNGYKLVSEKRETLKQFAGLIELGFKEPEELVGGGIRTSIDINAAERNIVLQQVKLLFTTDSFKTIHSFNSPSCEENVILAIEGVLLK